MRKVLEWILSIKTVSPNKSEHWTAKMARNNIQANHIWASFKSQRPKFDLPALIRLTRISSRNLDSDNLQGALKHVRDCVADQILPGLAPGRADGDPRLQWEYAQKKGKEQGVKIEIFETYEQVKFI